MSRLLFLLVIGVVVYWLLKSYRRQLREDQSAADTSGQAEDMVRCAQCGVHLPKHESLLAQGEYFCCEAHRLAHTEQPK